MSKYVLEKTDPKTLNKNKKVYDAHIHIPLKYSNPYERLKKEINDSAIDGALLIINTPLEANVFWTNFEKIMTGDLGFVPEIAFCLAFNSSQYIKDFDYLDSKGIKYAVKLHPRLTNIRLSDFEDISRIISHIRSDTIIVDNWIFGPKIENHIGTELTIYLAEKYQNKRIIMAHSGGVRLLETMLLTRPLHNVYYDLSETCSYFQNTSVYNDILHFIKYTHDRIMFGSDYPDFSISSCISITEKELEEAGLSDDEKNSVMYYNALKVYSDTSGIYVPSSRT